MTTKPADWRPRQFEVNEGSADHEPDFWIGCDGRLWWSRPAVKGELWHGFSDEGMARRAAVARVAKILATRRNAS